MTSEISEYTWQTLYEYIERRITGVLKALQLLREDARLKNLDEVHITAFERELAMLRGYLPLVRAMQNRENLKSIRPIMSLGTIRLLCRPKHTPQENFMELAWISPIADGRYSLVRLEVIESQEPEEPNSFEVDLIQIVEEVEILVKEKCACENR
jgi:hypothetical protein